MKTVVDLDDDLLARVAAELGTGTKKDTVHAALAFVIARRQRAAALLDDVHTLGVGEDIGDPEVMGQARR